MFKNADPYSIVDLIVVISFLFSIVAMFFLPDSIDVELTRKMFAEIPPDSIGWRISMAFTQASIFFAIYFAFMTTLFVVVIFIGCCTRSKAGGKY